MPTKNPRLLRLHERWATIANTPASQLTRDERRSLDFYLADVGGDPMPTVTVERWVTMVHDVDDFVAQTGRMPFASAIRPRPKTEEQRLVDRLAYQRRPSTRAGMTEYQRVRLETLPGFLWDPRDATWQSWLEAHQLFWADEERPPRRRSSDPVEASIARWVAHQRALAKTGTLPASRERALRRAKYRVL
ncbi:hypothetical protein [Curtobacterium flaccumfaciens]|uniref:hypothetical protein n=1 Tax=Curtobacterium flaccumfaciens TaxID=2035 RepID=UPI00188B9FA6|nr:hypothetical protein [Curtobacterium flaccumfaciens]MBF4628364.1 hypothetical protein [Curtobacterium flaccumfaciens]